MENIIEPPNAVASEQIVIGCMLTSKKLAHDGLENLEAKDFYLSIHQLIFKAMKSCDKKSRELDILSVSEELTSMDIKTAEGEPIVIYLTNCSQKVYPSMDISTHIDIIHEKRVRRDFIQTALSIYQRATSCSNDLYDSIEFSREALFKVDSSSDSDDGYEVSELISEEIDLLIKNSQEFEKTGISPPQGVSSGYCELDSLTNRFCDGHLEIIAARPGVGKTALALNMIRHMSIDQKKTVAFFSLEMSNKEIVQRLLSISSQIDFLAIKNSSLSEAQRTLLLKEKDRFQNVHIITYEDIQKTVSDIRKRCRRLKEKKGLDIIFIDYLQLIQTSGKNYENRQVEVADISRGLKALAMDLKVPVICLAQLSRRIEERSGGIPVLSDLRESGSVEQDADMVIFLTPTSSDPARKDHISMHLAKNRHGAIGKVEFVFKGTTLTFQAYSPKFDFMKQ